jgi:hypothetical protein
MTIKKEEWSESYEILVIQQIPYVEISLDILFQMIVNGLECSQRKRNKFDESQYCKKGINSNSFYLEYKKSLNQTKAGFCEF